MLVLALGGFQENWRGVRQNRSSARVARRRVVQDRTVRNCRPARSLLGDGPLPFGVGRGGPYVPSRHFAGHQPRLKRERINSRQAGWLSMEATSPSTERCLVASLADPRQWWPWPRDNEPDYAPAILRPDPRWWYERATCETRCLTLGGIVRAALAVLAGSEQRYSRHHVRVRQPRAAARFSTMGSSRKCTRTKSPPSRLQCFGGLGRTPTLTIADAQGGVRVYDFASIAKEGDVAAISLRVGPGLVVQTDCLIGNAAEPTAAELLRVAACWASDFNPSSCRARSSIRHPCAGEGCSSAACTIRGDCHTRQCLALVPL